MSKRTFDELTNGSTGSLLLNHEKKEKNFGDSINNINCDGCNYVDRFKNLWKNHELTKNIELMCEFNPDRIRIENFKEKKTNFINNLTVEIIGKASVDNKTIIIQKYIGSFTIHLNEDVIEKYKQMETNYFLSVIKTIMMLAKEEQLINKTKKVFAHYMMRITASVKTSNIFHTEFDYCGGAIKEPIWPVIKIILVSFYKQDGPFHILPMELIQYIFSFLGIEY